MANKTANVNARVEEDVKKEAEGILNEMGIPVSVGINMFYRQIIYCHGLPFRPVVPNNTPKALSDMSREEFDARMAAGLADAKAGRGLPVDEAFEQLLDGLVDKAVVNE
ncbi:MAG: type II toxin-antitoxin system RelB/DinJ family antitoxin [Lachnospiraceae bacterium]|jgi:DNA-damage-inducible protein J|nr:type II toxin-antitoxin system RelB/DinJ family antitoxin [Lachnospiraceae bacterium]